MRISGEQDAIGVVLATLLPNPPLEPIIEYGVLQQLFE
jgi:hypothetical protein